MAIWLVRAVLSVGSFVEVVVRAWGSAPFFLG